ncbi:MAG: hypothetical protein WBL95_01240 [Microcoleus sp.]
MSQDLHFYKQKILDEDVAQKLKPEEVSEMIKLLLTKYDVEGVHQDFLEVFFKELEVFSIDISGYDSEIEELVNSKKVELIPENSRRFMMNKNVWGVLEKIIDKECSNIYSGENNSKSKSKSDNVYSQKVDKLSTIIQDFCILKEAFKRNSLFVDIH